MNRPFSIDWDTMTITDEPFSSPYDEVNSEFVKRQLLTFLIVTLHTTTEDTSFDKIIIKLDELAFTGKYDDEQLYKYAIITYMARAPLDNLMPLINRYLGRMAASGKADEARVRHSLMEIYLEDEEYVLLKEISTEAINKDAALPSGVLTVEDMNFHAAYYYYAAMADYRQGINKEEADKNMKSAYDFSVDYNQGLMNYILSIAPNIASWEF